MKSTNLKKLTPALAVLLTIIPLRASCATDEGNVKPKATLPAPECDKIYNFTELDEQKFDLKGKVVRFRLTGWGVKGEDLGNGIFRYMVKDTAKPIAFYGKVDFPIEGVEKIRLGEKAAAKGKEPAIYLLVTPRTKEVVAQFTALGTIFKKDADGNATYSW